MRQMNITLVAMSSAFVIAACLALAAPSQARESRFAAELFPRSAVEASPPLCPVAPSSAKLVLAYRAPSSAMPGYNQGLDMRDDEGYNSDYIFVMTRSVAASSMTPAVKPLLFLFTVPLDIAFLPFAAIGGFF